MLSKLSQEAPPVLSVVLFSLGTRGPCTHPPPTKKGDLFLETGCKPVLFSKLDACLDWDWACLKIKEGLVIIQEVYFWFDEQED